MAHFELRIGQRSTNGKIAEIVVDGKDITDSVLVRGFSIEPLDPGPAGIWVVKMMLSPTSIDVDIPDAILEVLRAEPDAENKGSND